MSVLFAGGALPGGKRLLARATLDSMWTPQFADAGATTGFGIGFGIDTLDGHRTVGHGGAIYGFATSLGRCPTIRSAWSWSRRSTWSMPVTDAIADAALRMLLAARAGEAASHRPTPAPLTRSQAIALMGRYAKGDTGVDLEEYEGRLYLTPVQGGMRVELRWPARTAGRGRSPTSSSQHGRHCPAAPGRIAVGKDTLKRLPTPGSENVAMARAEAGGGRATNSPGSSASTAGTTTCCTSARRTASSTR